MLLVSIKLDDDVRDGGGWLAKLLQWKYRHASSKVHEYFTRLDPDFSSRIQQFISNHLALEQLPAPSLSDYVKPTADAFGYVFSLLSRLTLPENKLADSSPINLVNGETWLAELGRHVGAAIIAFDCAVDWQNDQRTGAYNPLQSLAEAEQALLTCRAHLWQAVSSLRATLGPDSQTAQLLEARAAQLPSLQTTPVCERAWNSFSNWDFLRQRRYVYAGDCGGCDCSGCDGCDGCSGCEGGGGDCGACGGDGHDHCHGCGCGDHRSHYCDCFCDPCCFGGTDASSSPNKKKKPTDTTQPSEPPEEETT